MVYVHLSIRAMLIAFIFSTRKLLWRSAPSKSVATVQIIDVLLTFALAILGLAMTKINFANLGLTIIVALIAAIIIDLFYQPIMKNK